MTSLPQRVAIATLGLLFGTLSFATALVLALSYGVTLDALLLPTLLGMGVALLASLGAYLYARTLTRELLLLQTSTPANAPTGMPSFDEALSLSRELRSFGSGERSAEPVRMVSSVPLRIRFIAAMGHDLRTPLNAMLGFADLLALDKLRTWNPQQEKSLGILRERTRDLLTLIDGMIDWAKLEAGDLGLTRALVAATPLIERAIATAIERSGDRGLRIDAQLAADLGEAYVDAERFVQALIGLMDHATRVDNAPLLALRARRESRGSAGEVFVRVDVIDAQLEIRDADRAHLFEAFRPSYAPTGRRIAGLRLGTAVARSLMRAQGGDVWFERRPERGTTFALAAPTTKTTARVGQAAAESQRIS